MQTDFINSLTPRELEIFQLVNVNGFSYAQAAKTLCVTVESVRNRSARVDEKLKAYQAVDSLVKRAIAIINQRPGIDAKRLRRAIGYEEIKRRVLLPPFEHIEERILETQDVRREKLQVPGSPWQYYHKSFKTRVVRKQQQHGCVTKIVELGELKKFTKTPEIPEPAPKKCIRESDRLPEALRQVYELAEEGKTIHEIAAIREASYKTIENQIRQIRARGFTVELARAEKPPTVASKSKKAAIEALIVEIENSGEVLSLCEFARRVGISKSTMRHHPELGQRLRYAIDQNKQKLLDQLPEKSKPEPRIATRQQIAELPVHLQEVYRLILQGKSAPDIAQERKTTYNATLHHIRNLKDRGFEFDLVISHPKRDKIEAAIAQLEESGEVFSAKSFCEIHGVKSNYLAQNPELKRRFNEAIARNKAKARSKPVSNNPAECTETEKIVLELFRQGLSKEEIAERMGRSAETIQHRLESLRDKGWIPKSRHSRRPTILGLQQQVYELQQQVLQLQAELERSRQQSQDLKR